MSITAPAATPAELTATLFAFAYDTEQHDCVDLDEFNPIDCPPCLGCNHCAARHQDLPIGRGVCDAAGCECFHYSTGDDCETCSGTGTVADSTDNEHECSKCGGHGVIA